MCGIHTCKNKRDYQLMKKLAGKRGGYIRQIWSKYMIYLYENVFRKLTIIYNEYTNLKKTGFRSGILSSRPEK